MKKYLEFINESNDYYVGQTGTLKNLNVGTWSTGLKVEIVDLNHQNISIVKVKDLNTQEIVSLCSNRDLPKYFEPDLKEPEDQFEEWEDINENIQKSNFVFTITGKFYPNKHLDKFKSILKDSISSDNLIPMKERWYFYPDRFNGKTVIGFQILLINKHNALDTIKKIKAFLVNEVCISVGISNEESDGRYNATLRTWYGNSAVISGRNLDKMNEFGLVINTNVDSLTTEINNSIDKLERCINDNLI